MCLVGVVVNTFPHIRETCILGHLNSRTRTSNVGHSLRKTPQKLDKLLDI